MASKFARILSTWFGCGYSPKAPGTAGTAAAVLIGVALHHYCAFVWWHFLLLATVTFPLAVWAAGRTASDLHLDDPQIVVIDEVIGAWITMAGARQLTPASYIAAFALFRVFDIWKPSPVRQLERLHGGLGIVADDVMAGVYAALVLLLAGCFNLY